LTDGLRKGTRHSQKTLEHFNKIVFGGIVANDVTGDEDAESSEMELGTEDDLSNSNVPRDSPQDAPAYEHHEGSSHTAMISHSTEQFQAMTISTSSRTHYPHQPIQCAHPEVITHPLVPANSSHPTTSFRQSTNPVSVSSSCQNLVPTPSFSAPPPPIIDPEPQPIPDDNIVPSAESSSVEDAVINLVITQPTTKGNGKTRAKKAAKLTQRQVGSDTGNALPQRSTRAGH
jgi:hypothetical protein